jgi:hypothetical protein
LKRAVFIHSFHSQVAATVKKIKEQLDSIFSLDSHLDCNFIVNDIVSSYPKAIRLAALRTSAHTMIMQSFQDGIRSNLFRMDRPRMFVAVPKLAFEDQVRYLRSILAVQEFSSPTSGEIRRRLSMVVSDILGIKMYLSPPRKLVTLVERNCLEKWLLDIDIDYVTEMQGECYSPAQTKNPNDLGKLDDVKEIIRIWQPSFITISETTVSAIHDKKSEFSQFLAFLKNRSYNIKYANLLPSDNEANSSIAACLKVSENVQRKLLHRYGKELELISPEAQLREYSREIKKFFSKNHIKMEREGL